MEQAQLAIANRSNHARKQKNRTMNDDLDTSAIVSEFHEKIKRASTNFHHKDESVCLRHPSRS